MNRYLRRTLKGLLIVGAIAALDLVSYSLWGKRRLHIECMKNLKTLAYDIDSIGVFSPYIELTNDEQVEIRKAQGVAFKTIEFVANNTIFSKKYRHSESRYGFGYIIERMNMFEATTIEYNGTLYYGEEWKSKYVWLILFWVQTSQENIGQS